MNENIKKLIQKVALDKDLQAEIKSITNPDEAYEFAITIQDGFSKEEFIEVMKKLSESTSDSEELTDEEVAGVSGGNATTIAGYTIGIGSITAVAGASAAAF